MYFVQVFKSKGAFSVNMQHIQYRIRVPKVVSERGEGGEGALYEKEYGSFASEKNGRRDP